MKLFKPKYIDRNGKKHKTKKWYLDFSTANGIRHKFPLYTDKTASETFLTNFRKLCDRDRESFIGKDIQEWIDKMPTAMLKKISSFGMLENIRIEGTKLIFEHIQDWKKSLIASGADINHIQAIIPRATKVVKGCGFRVIGDIDISKVETFLVRLRDVGEVVTIKTQKNRTKIKKIGKATYNGYIRALRQFGKWLVDMNKARQNPFNMLKRITCTKDDQKRPARTLTVAEIRSLIATTANAPDYLGIPGRERALIYLLCNESGIRAGEARQLQVRDFDFANWILTIRAEIAKNRKEAQMPLKKSTAEFIQNHVRGKLPSTTVFNIPAKPFLMIKQDLERAGIPYRNEQGTAHFHAQRHNFSTNIFAASTSNVKTTQSLMRHSDPRLTMNIYTHGVPELERMAIESLPNLLQKVVKKTGTDENSVFDVCLDKCTGFSRTNTDSSGQNAVSLSESNTVFSPAKTAFLSGKPKYPRKDSNLQPLAPEANALSN